MGIINRLLCVMVVLLASVQAHAASDWVMGRWMVAEDPYNDVHDILVFMPDKVLIAMNTAEATQQRGVYFVQRKKKNISAQILEHGQVAQRLELGFDEGKDKLFYKSQTTGTEYVYVREGEVAVNYTANMKQLEKYAAAGRAEEFLNYVLARELVGKSGDDGRTPLIIATEYKLPVVVGKLVTGGADVNATNEEGQTALMLAAQQGNALIIEELMKGEADISVKDPHGRTAIFYSVFGNNMNVCQMLVDAGADLEQTDDEGMTVIEFAKAKDQGRMAHFLTEMETYSR